MTDSYLDQLEREADDLRRQLAELNHHLDHLAPESLDAARRAITRRRLVENEIANACRLLPWEARDALDTLRSVEGGRLFNAEHQGNGITVAIRVSIESEG